MIQNQIDLDGNKIEQDFEKEWLEMPEYIHEDKTAERSIIVNFKTQDDVKKFSELIGQKITDKTRFIYYPECEFELAHDKRWISDES
jgi:hypothetical protein